MLCLSRQRKPTTENESKMTETRPRYLTAAETAKLIRKALKASFPGVKFSVRSKSYSMGASVNVSYIDGPTKEAVSQVTDAFRGSDFDGMIDLKTYRGAQLVNGELVSFGADYVFVEREFSEALFAAHTNAFAKRWALDAGELRISTGKSWSFKGRETSRLKDGGSFLMLKGLDTFFRTELSEVTG